MKINWKTCLHLSFIALPGISFGAFPCTVKQSGDPNPTTVVYRGKEAIFSPKSEGIAKVVTSPSGNYIALFASDTAGIDVGSSGSVYNIAIVNCRNGKVKGYLQEGNLTWDDIRWHETTEGVWFDFKGRMSLNKQNLP